MRILLWNTNNGINKSEQINYFKSFECDLAVLPELKEHNIVTLNPTDFIWVTNNHTNPKPKGLGILTFNNYLVESLPRDEDMEIFIPLKIRAKNISFNMLAVWNFYFACKQGRFKGVKGDDCLEWSAIRHYSQLFIDPTLVIGDWNFGPNCFEESFSTLVNMLKPFDLKSIYHEHFKLPTSDTQHSTFITPRKNCLHIDHMFGSAFFRSNKKSFHIEDLSKSVLSDHAPLVFDLHI